MKKLVTLSLIIFACNASYALPIGNPSEPALMLDGVCWAGLNDGCFCDPCYSWVDAFSFRLGFYGDYVFNRHLTVSDEQGGDIEDTEMFTNAGYIALNFCDRIDFFGTLGATNFNIETNSDVFSDLGLIGSRLVFETETYFSWSIGARATLWDCGCTTLGVEGQYFQTQPQITRVTVASIASEYPKHARWRYWEGQVGFGLSHRIDHFVPYIAVKWSKARITIGDDPILSGTPEAGHFSGFENGKNWGYAVGVSLVDCERMSVTAEGRFGDEKALYVNGQIRF